MKKVSEAEKLIYENCTTTKVKLLNVKDAYGYVLAEAIFSKIDTPPFDQSAMDGYAFSFSDWDKKSILTITSEIQAGSFSSNKLVQNEAVRIYTGAALPLSADTVVIQENVIVSNNSISIKDEQLIQGKNVRLKGSQSKKGECILDVGHLLSPASISFIAGTGIDKIKVFSNPTISIIVTGKELVQPGNEITEGKIYESNSFGLIAALNQLNISPISVNIVDDIEVDIIHAISKEIHTDILIITGGVSVGDYDFVASALEKCGVKKVFHKVKQKPGKPFYFGKMDTTLVFALPGNPAAVLTCFYRYIVDAISTFTKKKYFEALNLPLANSYIKKSSLTFILKGKTDLKEVEILEKQESYLMNSFAFANCIIELEEEKIDFNKGDFVKVRMII